jgi:tetratricopeptide (TPR) repeat protein
MFFEKRVYQGSSGRVYPLAFYSRVSDTKSDEPWDIWTLENEWIRIELMPELGGRIWRGLDKTNNYDFFYHQPVVKPALVGLAGPWISGGVEFNWPQHHRPATYLPTDTTVEEHEDGARTIWMSDHDPMSHMKGMHGITVYPNSSRVDLKARLYNRTPRKQTFLWWANAAAEVHDQYQSFFPPDVQHVADHAVRAISSFPVAKNHYYGIDYRPGTDLTWYRNIPVPTSYMITNTEYDFFGGYDYAAEGGFVHIADRHISPGKKQWTWGNHDFGRAWDRELTEPNAHGDYPPYIELMAGVYTDNQPDFSYLLPYETKAFTQTWWPIRGIGVAHQASRDFALHLSLETGVAKVGLCASTHFNDVHLRLSDGDRVLRDVEVEVAPDRPVLWSVDVPSDCREQDLTLEVIRQNSVVLSYRPTRLDPDAPKPETATEPAAPDLTASSDELYLTGEHLEQYRHPTREPEAYWLEGINRDPHDLRCNTGIGRRLLDRGLLDEAITHLQMAVERSRIRHPNPEDGEPLYYLGIALKRQGKLKEATRWLHKSTWNYAWRAPAFYQLATIYAKQDQYEKAVDLLDTALDSNASHNHARILKAAMLRKLGDTGSARDILKKVLADDPLDHWASYEGILLEEIQRNQEAAQRSREQWIEQTSLRVPKLLDVALDYADAGLHNEAIGMLQLAESPGHAIIGYTLAWLHGLKGDGQAAAEAQATAKAGDTRWCFPDRPDEELLLRSAMDRDPTDGFACLCLGNLLYDKRRYEEAISSWEEACHRSPECSAAWRNLGIAYFNARRDASAATSAYIQSFELAPNDPQILREYDLLLKVTGVSPSERLNQMSQHLDLVAIRDDLSIEYVTLLNLVGRHQEAAELLESRRFHPWEGGEGKVLHQHAVTHLAIGKQELHEGRPEQAMRHFQNACSPPDNLGEARHLLANQADLQYYLGLGHQALGDEAAATQQFEAAAANAGDFLEMGVQPFSEKSFYKGKALEQLGKAEKAQAVFKGMVDHGKQLCSTPAKIDYFATSLPDLLVFNTDLQQRRELEGLVLQGLGYAALDQNEKSQGYFSKALSLDPSNQIACDMKNVGSA